MSTWKDLEEIGEFIRKAVADLQLKVPSKGASADNEKGVYALRAPEVYLYALPNFTERPEPCILIQVPSSTHSPSRGTHKILCTIGVWDSGERELDHFDPAAARGVFQQRVEPKSIDRAVLGWKDLLAVSDRIQAALAREKVIGSMRVVDGSSTFEPSKEADTILDLFPFWGGTVTFEVERQRPPPPIEGL